MNERDTMNASNRLSAAFAKSHPALVCFLTAGDGDTVGLDPSEANIVYRILTEDPTGISVLHMLARSRVKLAEELCVSYPTLRRETKTKSKKSKFV